jgi:glycosyltransferase involved in cell wall biosynthesis
MSIGSAETEHDLDNTAVIEVVASIAPESFGLGYAALNLATALVRNGTNAYLVCVDHESDALRACEEAGFPRDRLICGSINGPARFRFSPSLLSRAMNLPHNGRSIVHLHGLWTYVSYVAGALRQKLACPLVVSPHGSLEPYALAISPRKKAAASLLFERRNLLTASCMWALSKQEETSMRAYGYRGRIVVLPNGVNRSNECSARELAEFRSGHNLPAHSRILLFLSRITPKKNIPLLLKAFARAVARQPHWNLVIAGSDEGGHIHEVQRLIAELDLQQSTRIIGPVQGREKDCAFSSASLFVLPSFSEGLPIAVLEAMEYGKPVIITDGWTLPVVTSAKYGWKSSTNEEDFTSVLMEAINMPEAALREIGSDARGIVRASFGWDSIAHKATSLYDSLLTAQP